MMNFLLGSGELQKVIAELLLAMLHYLSAEIMRSQKDLQHEAVSRLQGPAGYGDGKESETRSAVGAQDKRSQIKPPTKHKESSIERKDSSKTQHLEQDKSKNTEPIDLQERVKSGSQKATYVGSGSEGSQYEKIQKIKEPKSKTSDSNGDENSGGPFNQVVKVAIILGFGFLVLLTRQRRKRYQT